MSKYLQIVQEVHDVLATPEGREKVPARREHARKMAAGLGRWNELLKSGPMRRRGAVLTITQGALEKALARQGSLRVNVEVNGVGVGQIVFTSKRAPLFSSTKEPARLLEWSRNARHGKLINEYLETCQSAKSMPERDVQGQMSARFRALFDEDEKPLGGLVPVRPAGCMMEIPTAVSASGRLQVGGGAIDMLARTGRGNGWFIACELKKPGAAERPHEVLRQAIRYATALDVEVNGGRLLPAADAAVYRKVFGGTGSAPLRFGALAAISAVQRAAAAGALVELAAPKNTWLGALLYTHEAEKLRAVLVRP